MILRRETPADRPAIFAVQTAAFSRGDGDVVAEAQLVDNLRTDGDVVPALSLVATLGDDVVGHGLCSLGRVDGRRLLGLGPLGVLPAYQGRGVGHALMHGLLAAADALDEPAVAVLGDPSYYGRFGFVPAEPLGILPSDPEWAPYFQVRLLTAWDPSLRGTYRYAPAFDRL